MFIGITPTGSNLSMSSGSVVQPTISFDKDLLTLTVGAGTYRTFLTTDFSGSIIEYSLPQQVFDVTINTKYYVCVKYVPGVGAIMYLETDKANTNDSDVLVIYTVFVEVEGADILDWNSEGQGLVNKLNERFIDTDRFGLANGMTLSSANSILTSSPGVVYVGSNRTTFDECASNVDECNLMVKDGAGWTFTDVTVFPNTKYDDGSGTLATLTDGQYGVVWVWRSMGQAKELYIAMGSASYVSVESAKLAKIPSDLDERISVTCILLGRAIFLKGASSATVESAFDTVFNANVPTQHNSLLGLQGGIAGEHYHLTQAEHTVVQNTSNTNSGDETQSTIITKIGYTPESTSNKAASLTTSNDVLFPTNKAVNDELATKEPVITKNTAFNKNYSTTATDIKMNGTQSLGSLDTLPKVDHVHPSDTSKENTLTKGNLTAGSTKIAIGGSGTGAVIGAGVTVDVAEANLTHNSIGSLQGGNGSTEYYHTTSAEKTAITHSNRTNLDTINQNLATTSNVLFANIANTGIITQSVGTITPTSGANNNVVIPDKSIILITNTPGNFSITGLSGGVDGRMITLVNLGTSNMTITNLSGSSAATNQIDCLGSNFVTVQKGSVQLVYSENVQKWILVSSIS